MRDLLLLTLGFALVTTQATLGAVLDVGLLMPNTVLPVVLYLGMVPDLSLARAAILTFLLGGMLDSACGNAIGLFTFVHMAVLLGTRATGLRLVMRGRFSQVTITALVALVSGGLVVALLRIFRPAYSFEPLNRHHLFVALLAPALATGALAPFVFQLVRRVDSLRRREEPQAVS